MFTGIIEELGRVKAIKRGAKEFVIEIEAPRLTPEIQIGDSVAVNGVCLTATTKSANGFTVDVMPETVVKTDLEELTRGETVNLERAMTLSNRLGGHMVSGHVDGVGIITSKAVQQNALLIKIEAPASVTRYLIERGSIAVDGISLTVMDYGVGYITVSIIPHTAKMTTLGFKSPGDRVNLEADLIGKYVEKFINKKQDGEKSPGLTIDKLRDMGFA
ncbi:MAG: riboflavin synthase [Candidatus Aquicultor secundus]|uniref:Riboflavin synthase n=1 Tax=Candidatus Aquicultor secundus TaxID=1973895 RepID=A0A2M7T874_9ACTN|nr:riboflavin synthase [Candidatus Aquicultor secundus]NCO65237.1 riboflavin synthase [Solirubrobacter sp.]OIO87528.1 MAG: riboflavin synthase subunit alpha [Candidatus Aquicultor secundus]PIU26811.1 MAG: riboflavin synthase [Candidatus Aquicultor secundus]PIW21251.1 MAG: riboflavin synthase [Candidatus Aquicultor secundus]PIX52455.1 MAG: riboflavin synthase [Candidatus Aquicultor secundus]